MSLPKIMIFTRAKGEAFIPPEYYYWYDPITKTAYEEKYQFTNEDREPCDGYGNKLQEAQP